MNQWKYIDDEIEGVHPNKAWLTDGTNRALFKPDTYTNESEIELEAYRIAAALDIPCAKIELLSYNDKTSGTISYDFKQHNDTETIYQKADDMYYKEKSDTLTHVSVDSDGSPIETISMTFENIKNYIPQIESKVIDMLYFDCLIRNIDRHGYNWELIVNTTDGRVRDLAPLFDHGYSLWSEKALKLDDKCAVPYADDVELENFKMFHQLCIEYPEQMQSLLLKTFHIELHPFVAERFQKMQEIYKNVHEHDPLEPPPDNTNKNKLEKNIQNNDRLHESDEGGFSLPKESAINKNVSNKNVPKNNISDEQIAKARSLTLLEYMQITNPSVIKRVGKRHLHKNHDSFVIDNGKDGAWYWNSKSVGGVHALDYVMKVDGMTFQEGVKYLTGDNNYLPIKKVTTQITNQSSQEENKHPEKVLKLPPAALNNENAIKYLESRGISRNTAIKAINSGIMYESINKSVVFLGNDNGKTKYAMERGINNNIKKEASGSDKRFGFFIPAKNRESKVLAVFESAIDTLAHYDIQKIGGTSWDGHRLSLGGTASAALNTFLEKNPGISHIQLCLDADDSGQKTAHRIIMEIRESNRGRSTSITISPPPIGKDYCDTLQSMRETIREKQKEAAQKQYINEDRQLQSNQELPKKHSITR